MGQYTKFKVNLTLIPNTPERIIQLLKDPSVDFKNNLDIDNLTDEERTSFPEHAFFNCPRLFFILGEGENKEKEESLRLVKCKNGDWSLSIIKSLKNYESEIELFFSWISPYVKQEGVCGTYKYEETGEREVSFLNGNLHIGDPEPDRFENDCLGWPGFPY